MNNLCSSCVGEAYLKDEIQSQGVQGECSYCGNTARSYGIDRVAQRIADAFAAHYTRTSDQPSSWQWSLLSDRESDYEWERDGDPVVVAIESAADIPEAAAQDIQEILCEEHGDWESAQMGEETEFADDSYYKEREANDERWQEDWRRFEHSLKTQARLFNGVAAKHLAEVFDGITAMRTSHGEPVVVDAGPEKAIARLWRARVFQSEEVLLDALCRPDQQLGSPPSIAATAGRMNARGISVFYGATDATVALAEVRPPVGSRVATAFFEIVRPIRLLDLSALNLVTVHGSIFDPKFGRNLERTRFFQTLTTRITQPVMPDDEAFEYLPTQAIADFLATDARLDVDGIIYPSVQVANRGLNVVLFHKASRVEELTIPKGIDLEAHIHQLDEDGSELEYSVIEWAPREMKNSATALAVELERFSSASSPGWMPDSDEREPTLRIDITSLAVNVVSAVSFATEVRTVSRDRMKKGAGPF